METKTIEITNSNFQELVLDASVPVLIDFWAEWCAPCKMLTPIMNELSVEYEGKLSVGKLDADQNQEVMQRYGVMSLPTLLLFKNGEPIERIQGFRPKSEILNKIEPHLD